MHRIRIPKAAENMEAATIGRWIKQQGDPIELGEPFVELVTDKADFEWEAEVAGTLLQIVAKQKSLVPVGYIIALVGEPGEALPDVSEENAALLARMRETVAPAGNDSAPTTGRSAGGQRIAAKPAARRLAREHQIDLADVARALEKKRPLTEEDVQNYIDARH